MWAFFFEGLLQWVNAASVSPDCYSSPLIVVSKIIIKIHFAVEKQM